MHHARREPLQVLRVPAQKRKRNHELVLDRGCLLAGIGFKQWRSGCDFDHLGHIPGSHLKVHTLLPSHLENNVFLDDLAEAFRLRLETIAPRLEEAHYVVADFGCGNLVLNASCDVLNHDSGAGNHSAGRVADGTENGTGVALPEQRHRRESERCNDS
ncbi:MAG: hypothetical protein L0Z50_20345 [Verrucomicrobiales bacterium]|nr:hypothetical protein [Verrucomicrobiales bacterium]